MVNVAASDPGQETGAPGALTPDGETPAGPAGPGGTDDGPVPGPAAGVPETAPKGRAETSAGDGDGPGWRRHRRVLAGAGAAAATVLLYLAYLGQARTLGLDADGASNTLQAWGMLHGNLLLRGWWLSDVSFYTTELPEYLLVELARGLNASVVPVAAALTYTLLVLLAAVLARGRATGRAGRARALVAAGIMLAPGTPYGVSSLLSSPDHIGTMVPLLVVWIAIDRLGDRWYLPWLAGAALAWVEVADQIAVYVGAVPLIVVSAIRLLQRRDPWRADASLLAAAVASVAVSAAALHLIRRAGGFTAAPTTTVFASQSGMPHNLWLTAESVLALFGADFFGQRLGVTAAVALLHLAGLALAAWAFCAGARRLTAARGRVVPILVVGVAVNLAAYLFSTQAIDTGATHELAAVLPFGAVLAGRLIPRRPSFPALAPALAVVLLVYAGVLGYNATRPAQPPDTSAVASWLASRHLDSGVGEYWAANVTTVATGGRVRVRAVAPQCGRFIPYAWETRRSWYQPPATARFLVLPWPVTGGAAAGARQAAEAARQFGAPARTARVGAYQVLVWDRNVMPEVTGGSRPGCGPRWAR